MADIDGDGFPNFNRTPILRIGNQAVEQRVDLDEEEADEVNVTEQFDITEGAPQPEPERPRSRLDRYMDDFFGRPF